MSKELSKEKFNDLVLDVIKKRENLVDEIIDLAFELRYSNDWKESTELYYKIKGKAKKLKGIEQL